MWQAYKEQFTNAFAELNSYYISHRSDVQKSCLAKVVFTKLLPFFESISYLEGLDECEKANGMQEINYQPILDSTESALKIVIAGRLINKNLQASRGLFKQIESWALCSKDKNLRLESQKEAQLYLDEVILQMDKGSQISSISNVLTNKLQASELEQKLAALDGAIKGIAALAGDRIDTQIFMLLSLNSERVSL